MMIFVLAHFWSKLNAIKHCGRIVLTDFIASFPTSIPSSLDWMAPKQINRNAVLNLNQLR